MNDERRTKTQLSAELVQLRQRVIELEAAEAERQRAEEALRDSEDRYRDLVENSQDLLCTHDLDGKLLSVNEAAVRLTGYPRAALLQINMADLLAPDVRRGFGAYLKKIRNTGQASGLMQIQTAGGETRYWEYDNTLRTEDVAEPIVRGMARDVTERKRAEAALRESEVELKEAQHVGRLGSWGWDATTDTITWSEEYYRIYGFDPKLPPPGYDEHLKLYTPESAARLDAAVKHSMQTGEGYKLDLEQARADGTRRWITAHGEVKRDAHGQIVGLRGTAQDITERKQAEEALSESHAQLAGIIDAAMDAIITADANQRILGFNLAAEEMFGYPAARAIGQPLALLLPERFRGIHREQFADFGDDGRTTRTIENLPTLAGVRANGEEFPVEISISRAEVAGQQLYTAIARDVTERKRVEAALAASEAELRALFASMHDTVLVIDREGIYREIAPTNPASWYIPPQELLGKRMQDVFPAEQSEVFYKVVQRVLATKQTTQIEYELIVGNQVVWYEASISPLSADSILWVARDITNRKRGQEEQARLSAILQATTDMVATADLKGFVLYINQAGRKMLGLGEDEDVTRTRITDYHTEWAAAVVLNAGIPTAIENGFWSGETAFVSRDGQVIPVSQVIIAHKARDGSIEYLSTIVRDITERKQSEESLRESESSLQAVLQSTADGILAVGSENEVLYANERFAEMWRIPRTIITSKDDAVLLQYVLDQLVDPQSFLQKVQELYRSAEESFDTLYFKDGRVFERFSRPLLQEPKPCGRVWSFRDITERKRAEEESITANKELLFQNEEKEKRAAELIVANKELLFQNEEKEKRAAELVVANKELLFQNEEKEKRAAELVVANKELLFQNEEKEKRAAELVVANKELLFQNEEKEKRAAELVVANKELAFQNEEKEKRAAELVVANSELEKSKSDIGKLNEGLEQKVIERTQELTAANARLTELDRLKDQFVSMVSHEYRTPLTTILSSAELLEHYSTRWSDDQKQNHLRQIVAAVKHMTDLLEGILFIGKIAANKLDFAPVPIDLAKYCRDLVEEFQLTAGNQYRLTLTSQLPCLEANVDVNLLRQILSNVLSNAIKYSPRGGDIEFELTCEDNQAVFQIHDHGLGIPKEDQAEMFETFHRGSNIGNIPGTGLGMAIISRSVALHHGTINIHSEVGAGTTVTITLPLGDSTTHPEAA
jgi:PAS domain S-box-containing protein